MIGCVEGLSRGGRGGRGKVVDELGSNGEGGVEGNVVGGRVSQMSVELVQTVLGWHGGR